MHSIFHNIPVPWHEHTHSSPPLHTHTYRLPPPIACTHTLTDWSRCGESLSFRCRVETWCVWCLLGGGGALQAAVRSEGPVFPSGGPECTLSIFATDLDLEDFLVTFLVLIGWQVHTWVVRGLEEEQLAKIKASGSVMSPIHMWSLQKAVNWETCMRMNTNKQQSRCTRTDWGIKKKKTPNTHTHTLVKIRRTKWATSDSLD